MMFSTGKTEIWSPSVERMLVALLPCRGATSFADSGGGTIPLFEGLGKHHYPVTTFKSAAQRYFDRGLIPAFGFNHA